MLLKIKKTHFEKLFQPINKSEMKKTWRVYPNTVLLYWYFSTIEESKKTTILKVNKFRLTFIRVTISKIVRRQHLVKV